ncbi:hypothetical protein JNJ66_04740 [Candidatus Saccharibacteria bacterium]|nr:hypothetical protein [Candidatus Saccharibacteria bacterium]
MTSHTTDQRRAVISCLLTEPGWRATMRAHLMTNPAVIRDYLPRWQRSVATRLVRTGGRWPRWLTDILSVRTQQWQTARLEALATRCDSIIDSLHAIMSNRSRRTIAGAMEHLRGLSQDDLWRIGAAMSVAPHRSHFERSAIRSVSVDEAYDIWEDAVRQLIELTAAQAGRPDQRQDRGLFRRTTLDAPYDTDRPIVDAWARITQARDGIPDELREELRQAFPPAASAALCSALDRHVPGRPARKS